MLTWPLLDRPLKEKRITLILQVTNDCLISITIFMFNFSFLVENAKGKEIALKVLVQLMAGRKEYYVGHTHI